MCDKLFHFPDNRKIVTVNIFRLWSNIFLVISSNNIALMLLSSLNQNINIGQDVIFIIASNIKHCIGHTASSETRKMFLIIYLHGPWNVSLHSDTFNIFDDIRTAFVTTIINSEEAHNVDKASAIVFSSDQIYWKHFVQTKDNIKTLTLCAIVVSVIETQFLRRRSCTQDL